MKEQEGGDISIFGSGTIVQQFTNLGLIDEYRLIVNPLILGNGKPLFKDVKNKPKLKLVNTRVFRNGNVLLCYEPAKN
jgi:dihydrofolate reductase